MANELNGFYGVNLLIDQNELRFGSSDQESTLYQRFINRQLLQSHVRLLQIQNHYANSYLSSSNITVGQMRDLLFSLSINFALRSSQCVDRENTQLTSHARNFWLSPYGKDFNTHIFSYEDMNKYDGFGGVVGSVANSFVFTEVNFQNPNLSNNQPITLLKYYIDNFWTQNNINFAISPLNKHLQILNNLFKVDFPLELIETKLNDIYFKLQALLTDAERPIFNLMKRTMISSSHWLNLRQRFILGEISPELLKILKLFILQSNEYQTLGMEQRDVNDFEKLYNNTFKQAQPGGMVLFYLAFIVNGLIEASIRLTDFIDKNDTSAFSWKEWCLLPDNPQEKLKIIDWLYLAIDGLDCLSLFNTLGEAREYSSKLYLLAVELLPIKTYTNETTRLLKFIDYNRPPITYD